MRVTKKVDTTSLDVMVSEGVQNTKQTNLDTNLDLQLKEYHQKRLPWKRQKRKLDLKAMSSSGSIYNTKIDHFSKKYSWGGNLGNFSKNLNLNLRKISRKNLINRLNYF